MNALISRSRTVSKLLLSPTTTLYTSLFSTSSSLLHYRFSSTYHKSQLEKVSVWWDMENCAIPTGGKVFKIVESITEAVRVNGIMGPLQINAFGDISRLNPKTFSNAGVNLVNAPNGLKNGADISLLVDLMYWVSQNPPPAHIFLISHDLKFAGVLHNLRKSKYNILLAAREYEEALDDLYSAASIIWHWNELAKGEILSGMHSELLPGCSFSSWYQYYRALCDDPFTMWERQKLPALETASMAKQSFSFKHRPIPAAFLKQLLKILNSYPGGLAIAELRNELEELNVSIDKAFYGYKSFSHVLLALPYIVEVQPRPDGEFFVRFVLIAILESVQRKRVPLECMADNGSPKVLDAPLRHDKVASTEEKKLKHQNVSGCKIGAERSGNVDVPHSAKLDEEVSPLQKLDDEVPPLRMLELFSKGSFRSALLTFLRTRQGSHVILNSTSREQLAERLEKEELSILWHLRGDDLRQLVDRLVSEKWIKEFPTRSPPFELSEEISSFSELQDSTWLSSLHSNLSSENPEFRAFSFGHNGIFGKSRSEMLADCNQFLDDFLLECSGYLKIRMQAVDEFENFRSRSKILADCEKHMDNILSQNPEFLDDYEEFIKLVALLSIHPQG